MNLAGKAWVGPRVLMENDCGTRLGIAGYQASQIGQYRIAGWRHQK